MHEMQTLFTLLLLAVYIIGYLLNKCRSVATQPDSAKAIATFSREMEFIIFIFLFLLLPLIPISKKLYICKLLLYW